MDNFRRRLTSTNAGDYTSTLPVVLYNKQTGNLEIIEGAEWSIEGYPEASYSPVGVVVIPREHGVLKNGGGTVNQCGIISLVPMNYQDPEKNQLGIYTYSPCYGCYQTDITGIPDGLGRYDSVSDGLKNYGYTVTVDRSNPTVPKSSFNQTYIPRQAEKNGIPAYTSSSTKYCAPSPYAGEDLKSGEFNTAYSDTTVTNENALSDFSGIVNTKILTDIHTIGQSDWKTASTITNSSEYGYAPAAACCARYKTEGTKAFCECTTEELKEGSGFWYLPSCGELGYIAPRLMDIYFSIKALKEAYNYGNNNLPAIGPLDPYISSTESGNNYTRALSLLEAKFSLYSKNASENTVAFMRL